MFYSAKMNGFDGRFIVAKHMMCTVWGFGIVFCCIV